MILNCCPKIVGVRLEGSYDESRAVELEAQLGEAHNAEIVLVDVRAATGIDRSCLSRLVRLRHFLQGICSIRMVGASPAIRAGISDAGAARELAVLDSLDEILAEIYIDANA